MAHVGEESRIPEGLLKRWEEFAELSRECWKKVKELELPTAQAFEAYWQCMRSKGAHLMTVEEAIEAGVKAHPICVLAKMAKGLSEEEAEMECKKEGKFHGISLLAAEIRRELG